MLTPNNPYSPKPKNINRFLCEYTSLMCYLKLAIANPKPPHIISTINRLATIDTFLSLDMCFHSPTPPSTFSHMHTNSIFLSQWGQRILDLLTP